MQEPQEMRVWSQGQEDPLEEKIATNSSIIAGKSQGQRSLLDYSPWGCKESDTTMQLSTRTMHTCSGVPNMIFPLIPSEFWPFGFFFQC